MEKKLVCISCPIGCELTAKNINGTFSISGNRCIRGEIYAKEELVSPKRVVTATCQTDSKIFPRLPVKTSLPVPKQVIFELLKTIYSIKIKLPIKRGDILIKNYNNSGVDVISTKTLAE